MTCPDPKSGTEFDSAVDLLQILSSSGGTKDPYSWRILFSFTKRGHLGILAGALAAAALVSALRTLLSVILGRIFDLISQFGQGIRTGHSTLADVSTLCLVLVGMGIGSWTANSSFLSLWVVFGELQANEARNQVFASLLSKQVEWFSTIKGGIEGLHSRIYTQTRDFQLGTSQVLGFVICDAVTSCASIGIAFYYSWKLALVLLSTLPVSFIILCFVTRNSDSELWSQKQYLQRASTYAVAAINGIDLVAAFGGHDKELSKYGSTLKLAAHHFAVQARCNSIQMGYIAFWSISIFILGFWYGLVLVGQGVPPGHIVTTFYAILTAFQGVEAFASHWLVLTKGKAAGVFLTSLTTKEQVVDKLAQDVRVTLDECIGDVRLDKVNYAYESSSSSGCLSEVSLHFPPQQMTFLIGDSGSGKSTICALISKLLSPTSGEVTLDGYPVHQLHDECLRRHITLIHQSSPIIGDTFFNNVALGHRCPAEANASEVRQACEFAQLDSTVSNLRCGMSTVITPDDHQLSGGQRQRLALARARLRDPAVLILDEPTSSLDPTNQIKVMTALREWRKDKTTIIVTHDLSNIEDRDFVYILKDGAVFRQGRMQELKDVAGALCCPEVKDPVNRNSLVSALSVEPSGVNRFSQVYGSHPRTRFSRASFHTISSMLPESCEDISAGPPHTSAGRKVTRPLSGWQITSDIEGKQQQFSSYLDCRFEITETDKKTSKPDWQFKLSDGAQLTKDNMPSEKTVSGYWSTAATECESGRYSTEVRQRTKASDSEQSSTSTGLAQGLPHRPVDSLFGIIGTIWPSLGRRDRVALIFAVIICLVAAAATPVFSYCLAQLLASMWAKSGKEEGVRWATYLAVVAVVDGVCTGGGHYLFETIGQTWVDNLRKEAFSRILEQPRSWFQETRTTPGQLSQCLDRNAQEMRTIMGKILPVAIVVASITSISIIWSMVITWKLTMVTLSSLPLIMVAVRAYSLVSSKWEQRCLDAAADTSTILKEILLNFEFVRIFALESYFTGKQHAASSATLRSGLKRSLYTGPLFGLYQSITMPLMALVFYYGTSISTKDSRTSVDQILQVINLLLFSIGTTFELLNGLPQLTASTVAATELLRYAHLPKVEQNTEHLTDQPSSLLPVVMRDLDFSPDGVSPKLLSGLSLEIHPGASLAIAGPSGSGKSTALSLLLGINTPSRTLPGQSKDARVGLTFDNVPYFHIDPRHLRSIMAYVPQRPFLFPATIAENIAYGLPKACPQSVRDSVVQAAKEAGIHDFIESLPNAYDTLVGDGGQALSGGQAQLVNIARALARKPQLLIMDEPTSALDAESAAAVHSVIESLTRSSRGQDDAVALVVATHSVKMLQLVDNIVVLDGGIKVEQGTYATLEANRGPLWQLVTYQREGP